MRIHLTGIRHASEATVAREVASGDVISDASAAAIASWWQSPGRVGRHLAALASGAPVDADDVRHDIAQTMIVDAPIKGDALAALDALAAWVDARDDDGPSVHFHTGRNLAGYMPESDVTCHGDDWQAAADAIAEDMREYADRDDDAAYDVLSSVPASDYPTLDDGTPDYGDDTPAMRATVDAILKDDGPRERGGWLAYVNDNDGRSIAFWISAVPADDCEDDGTDD